LDTKIHILDWVLLIFVSVFVRILVAINRLNDFRLKARIAGNKKTIIEKALKLIEIKSKLSERKLGTELFCKL